VQERAAVAFFGDGEAGVGDELSQRLRAAAEVGDEQPPALSSRAVTTEAGCAKGLLHNHFPDFDGFLAEFAIDRFHRAVEDSARVTAQPGTGSVATNLATAAAGLFDSRALAVATLVMARPSVMTRVHGHRHTPAMFTVQQVFVSYLEAEQRLGRVRPDADVETAVLALLATAHHLCIMHAGSVPDPLPAVRRVADLLVAAVT